ncbi:TIGR03617 family F420-dependent LLM class oxidoreductase [Nocardia seriolae]|uniref:F420-dependent oxidoreductase n=1 Tax=Nocardia seriolae TaxID=37332 RepID=A0ABC9Z709_9NOCA|nr:TIGR03617 family F420-dependent LLM class oxidoreductase [Nocardia seriolae]BEK94751.1 LLM class F420-dependent oxidoreductase [Nocardia seriolae]GAM51436.1 oxidoreductase [Nocardia seriolae]GAP33415.1 F420-dependent oxidoreductase [Nocardia seriolae]
MKVYAALDPRLPLSAVPRVAKRLEELGFDGIHIPETIHDSFAVALLAAEHTARITVRTAITLAFVRSPTLVAYSAWDLAKFSGGRFELGLGTQIRQNIEDRYGMPWSEPVTRMGEYLAVLRELFSAFASGGSIEFEGGDYRITRMQPYFNPGPDDRTAPPILLGAVNPGMCRLAGRLADGVITHSTNSDPGYLRDVVRPALLAGAEAAGRTPPALIAATTIATGPDADAVTRERERLRRLQAFLYSTPAYRSALERLGLPKLFDRLRDLVRTQQWDRLHEVMTDDILDTLLISGDYDALPELIHNRYHGLAAGVVMSAPAEDPDDARLKNTIEQIRAQD